MRISQDELPRGVRPDKAGVCTRGDGESISSYCNRARTYLDAMANRSEVSFRWYTHTNPAGCWICDTFVSAFAILRELRRVGEYLEDGERAVVAIEGEEDINSEVHNKDS